jgi:hypothetical protein
VCQPSIFKFTYLCTAVDWLLGSTLLIEPGQILNPIFCLFGFVFVLRQCLSLYVAQAGLKLIMLSQPSKCWDFRRTARCPAKSQFWARLCHILAGLMA